MTIEELIEMANQRNQAVPKARKPRHEEEHRIQAACVRWWRLQYPRHAHNLFAVPNGGWRGKATAGKLKAEGVVAGVSDLILLLPSGRYHGLCIEMKTRTGRQAESQKEWQAAIEQDGYRYIICRSLEEFMEQVTIYLNE